METDERLVLFQTSIQDIRDLKANQWRFSNYGLLIQAALVAVDIKLETKLGWVVELVLIVLSLAAGGVICWLIYEAQQKLVQRRHAVDDLSVERDGSMRGTRQEIAPKAQPPPSKPWACARKFAILFFGAQIIAAFLAISVIWLESPASIP